MSTFDNADVTVSIEYKKFNDIHGEEITKFNFHISVDLGGVEVVLATQTLDYDYDYDSPMPLEKVFEMLNYHDVMIKFIKNGGE